MFISWLEGFGICCRNSGAHFSFRCALKEDDDVIRDKLIRVDRSSFRAFSNYVIAAASFETECG